MPDVVYLPHRDDTDAWSKMVDEWDNVWGANKGHPNACLAIDGSIFFIQRPSDFEGWYCKSNSPAMNVQCLVDAKKRIRSFDIRAGSNNDQSIWDMSYTGRFVSRLIPAGLIILADAGYKLMDYMMCPYPDDGGKRELTPVQAHYNKMHSRSRIVVEVTFGWIKNRFRSLKGPMNRAHKGNSLDVASAFVIHNLLIDFADDCHGKTSSDTMAHMNEKDCETLGLDDTIDRRKRGAATRDSFAEYMFQRDIES